MNVICQCDRLKKLRILGLEIYSNLYLDLIKPVG